MPSKNSSEAPPPVETCVISSSRSSDPITSAVDPPPTTEVLLELTNGDGIDIAVDFVSSTSTLEAAAKALGRHGRLITLGGSGERFQVDAQVMLMKEQDLLGSRYVTHSEVVDALSLVAAGDVWPMVTEIRPLIEANELHDRIEAGEVIGRAAVLID